MNKKPIRYLCVGIDTDVMEQFFPHETIIQEKEGMLSRNAILDIRTRTGFHSFEFEYYTMEEFLSTIEKNPRKSRYDWTGTILWMSPDLREFASSVKKLYEWHQSYHADDPILLIWEETDLQAIGLQFPSQGSVSVFGPVEELGNLFLVIMSPEARPDDLWYRIAELSTDTRVLVETDKQKAKLGRLSRRQKLLFGVHRLIGTRKLPGFIEKRVPPLPPYPITISKIIETLQHGKQDQNLYETIFPLQKQKKLRKPPVSRRRSSTPKKQRLEHFALLADAFASLGRSRLQSKIAIEILIEEMKKEKIHYDILDQAIYVSVPFEHWYIDFKNSKAVFVSNPKKRIWRLPWQVVKSFERTKNVEDIEPGLLPVGAKEGKIWISTKPITVEFIQQHCLPYWKKLIQTVKRGLNIIKESGILTNPPINDTFMIYAPNDTWVSVRYSNMKFPVTFYLSELLDSAAKGELETQVHSKVWQEIAPKYIDKLLTDLKIPHTIVDKKVILQGRYHWYEVNIETAQARIHEDVEELCIVLRSSLDAQAVLRDPEIERLSGLKALVLDEVSALVLPTMITLAFDDEVTDAVLLAQIIK